MFKDTVDLEIIIVIDVCVCDAGESGLHLAIVNNDKEMVKRLVTCGADVNQRASGRFFLPEDQKQLRNGVTNYSGLFCYVTLRVWCVFTSLNNNIIVGGVNVD